MKKLLFFALIMAFLFAGCSKTYKPMNIEINQVELPMIYLNAGYWSYIDGNGGLYTWGFDERDAGIGLGNYLGGSLGQGTEVIYNNKPVKIYSDVNDVILGNRALTKNGEIIEWGKKRENESCVPEVTKDQISIVGISLYLTQAGDLYTIPEWDNARLKSPYDKSNNLVMTGVKDFAIGYNDGYNGFALKEDGSVWAFASNSSTAEIITEPKKLIDGVEKIIGTPSANAAILFIKSDKTLWCCGGNEYGQCGNGEYGDFNMDTRECVVTKPLKLAENVIDAWLAEATIFYLTADNKLYACGQNYSDLLLIGGEGQTNLDDYPEYTTTPVLVMSDIKQMEYSDMGMYVLKTDNTVWSWGYADKGFLGNGMCYKGEDLSATNFTKRISNKEAFYSQPTQIMENVERLFTETIGLHFVQKIDGSIWYWGYGEIYVGRDDEWDTHRQWKDNDGNIISAYQKHYIIPTPIEFSIDKFFQNALDSIAAQGIDVSQYDAATYKQG